MLLGLAIRDIVLVDRLDLRLGPGLNVLTGETGAGKSILLDALGLALGGRADVSLIRHGAERGSVGAEFDVPAEHSARALMAERELDAAGTILVRRVLDREGRSRAFVNDQPVAASFLRDLGDTLIEIHGGADHGGALDRPRHRLLLDDFGGLGAEVARVGEGWRAMGAADEALSTARERLDEARREEDYLRHVVAELDALAPGAGEEDTLAERRALLMHAEKIAEALAQADSSLNDEGGVAARLRGAERTLLRVADKVAGRLDKALAALDRAGAEVAEAVAAVEAARRELELDPGEQDRVEERLFALRALARKHKTPVDGLAGLRDELAAKLAALDDGAAELARLEKEAGAARAAFEAAGGKLGKARRRAASRLDKAMAKELPPLKLDKARFLTLVEALEATEWSRHGTESVAFQVATNPGAPPGPLTRIASAGELSRFLLALKVVLAGARAAPTLIFDEIDRGVGGATADAVGERLSRLSADSQILIVTHSPQVAARSDHHWRVSKEGGDGRTHIEALDAAGRREEIARMLAGAEITVAARAAAESLIEGQGA
jgi:DNA repair protein RecN (Recombination protein N)